MPVHVEKRAGKFRIIEPNGAIAKTDLGNPRDGGGHTSEKEAYIQAYKINNAEAIYGQHHDV